MMRLRVSELVLGFLLGFASLLIIFLLSSDVALHDLVIALDTHNGIITAIATGFIAWFTLSLRQSTDKLWDAGERQLKLTADNFADQSRDMQASIAAANRSATAAERALFELERPWIFVAQTRAQLDSETHEFFIEYTVANYGKLPAIIEYPTLGFVLNDAHGNPQPPVYPDETHSLVSAPILAAGEHRRLKEYFPASEDGTIKFRETVDEHMERVPDLGLGPNQDMFFRAVIRYRGPTSIGHETGVSWLYREPFFDFVARSGVQFNYNR